MKRFIDFLNEAQLKGSKGLPSDYLSDVESKAQRELGVTKDSPQTGGRYFEQIMKLTQDSSRVAYGGLSPQDQRNISEKLEELAKEVIYAEYGNILDNVDLDIRLVPYGKVAEEMPELSDISERPASKREQEREMQSDEEKEDQEEVDKKKSFLDKLFKKSEEKEKFVGSEEYKERVDKAKLINNIIQGEAKNTKKILHSELVKQGLTKIFGTPKDKQIFKVWDDLTKVADKLDWIIPIEDKAEMMASGPGHFAGSVQVKWPESEQEEEYEEEESEFQMEGDEDTPSPRSAEDILKELESGEDLEDLEEEIGELFSHGNPVIKVVGVDFPMLLHETVKGIYELIAAAYLPSAEAQKEEIKKAKVVKMAVSSYEDEAEDFRYGPFIAAALRDFVNNCKGSDRYPNMREYVFGKMVLLEAKEFLSLMKEILEKSNSAKLKIEEIISEIIDELREYEISMIDEPDYGGEEKEEKEEVEEDEIEKLIKKSQEPDEVESDEVDYSTMSKRELQEVIDQALEDEDWATLDKIKPFIKESLEWKIYESEINRLRK